MDFDVVRTPMLEAVAIPDEQMLAGDLKRRVEETIQAAESRAGVREAIAAQEAAEEHLARLRRAERWLSGFAAEARERTASAAGRALDALIESAASGVAADFKALPALAAMERQSQIATRAIERVVERLIPLAHIASLRETSHALLARARAIEGAAQERAEKVLGKMREAVSDEMVLPVDLSKGVAGALLAHAAGLKRMAVQISENADRMERSYMERSGK